MTASASTSVSGSGGDIPPSIDPNRKEAREAQITAYALTVIAIVLMAIAFAFYGVGTLPAESIMGLGQFPFLGGVIFQALGIVVFVGALAHFAISSIYDCRSTK